METEEWLTRHNGVVRRTGLIRRGVTDAAIRTRVRSGDWQRAHRGVIVSPTATGEEATVAGCRAALMAAGKGAYLSCLGAAIHWGLPVPAGAVVHVSIPLNRVVSQQGLVAHRNAEAEPPTTYAGLPTVPVELALIQAFGCLDNQRFRRALVIESVRARLVAVDRVVAACTPGSKRRPELLELLAFCGGSESEAEIAMLLLTRGARLPEPARQHRVVSGASRYRLDLAYPEALLAIEVDGKPGISMRVRATPTSSGTHGWPRTDGRRSASRMSRS